MFHGTCYYYRRVLIIIIRYYTGAGTVQRSSYRTHTRHTYTAHCAHRVFNRCVLLYYAIKQCAMRHGISTLARRTLVEFRWSSDLPPSNKTGKKLAFHWPFETRENPATWDVTHEKAPKFPLCSNGCWRRVHPLYHLK
jgi:hypothetical protein